METLWRSPRDESDTTKSHLNESVMNVWCQAGMKTEKASIVKEQEVRVTHSKSHLSCQQENAVVKCSRDITASSGENQQCSEAEMARQLQCPVEFVFILYSSKMGERMHKKNGHIFVMKKKEMTVSEAVRGMSLLSTGTFSEKYQNILF